MWVATILASIQIHQDVLFVIVTDGYEKTEKILREHIAELHKVAQFLFEHEKMSGEQFALAMEGKPIPVDEDADSDDDDDLNESKETETKEADDNGSED